MFLISFFKNLAKLFINLICLLICLPIILIFVVLIYFEDKSNPIYSGLRVGKNFKLFTLYKLRSMILRENIGFQSTSINDKRILKIGKIIRSTKLDELPQIFNVIKGDINFVGPRPNVKEEVDKYIDIEKRILDHKPGITDFSSIIFSDEGEILKDSKDPDLDYNLLIRPRKNLIALLYFKDRSILIDIYIIFLTILNILNRGLALKLIYKYLNKKYNKHDLNFILRKKPLTKIQNINKYFKII